MARQTTYVYPDERFRDVVQTAEVAAHLLPDDGTFPNNERLLLLVYVGALRLPARDPAATIEQFNHLSGNRLPSVIIQLLGHQV